MSGHAGKKKKKNPQADESVVTDASGPASEANKSHQRGSACRGWGLLDGYQQGPGPAVHSFNKSDSNDLGKQFNDCFLSVFQHRVGGWSNATGQGRHSGTRCSKFWHFPARCSSKMSDEAMLCLSMVVLSEKRLVSFLAIFVTSPYFFLSVVNLNKP